MFAGVLGEKLLEVWRAGGEDELVSLEGFGLRGQGDISELVVLGQQLEVAWCKRGGGGRRGGGGGGGERRR